MSIKSAMMHVTNVWHHLIRFLLLYVILIKTCLVYIMLFRLTFWERLEMTLEDLHESFGCSSVMSCRGFCAKERLAMVFQYMTVRLFR